MRPKHADRLLRAFAVIALVVAITVRHTAAATVITLVCVLASLAVLYPNLARLANLSEDNPKGKTLRSVTKFNVGYLAAVIVTVVLVEGLEQRGLLSELMGRFSTAQIHVGLKLLMAFILAVPMLFFGNVAPQIPFNRYTGLRLPWTVRDEETWIVAHRVLGYISIPIALLLFVHVPTDMSPDTYVRVWWLGGVLLWVGIPGAASAVFYYKKWNGTL